MANSIWVDVLKTVVKTSFTSVFTAIAIIRLGMMIYPTHEVAANTQTAYQVEEGTVQIPAKTDADVDAGGPKTIAKNAPRVVFGQNSIENLKDRN